MHILHAVAAGKGHGHHLCRGALQDDRTAPIKVRIAKMIINILIVSTPSLIDLSSAMVI
jgi:hypothetical protein